MRDKPRLRTIPYKNICYPCEPRFGQLAYATFDFGIVFSGTTSKGTSTINARRQVLKAITEEEGIDPEHHRFFDLQTRLGYDFKSPGEYVYQELTNVNHWDDCECPSEVLELFTEHIGGPPRQRPSW